MKYQAYVVSNSGVEHTSPVRENRRDAIADADNLEAVYGGEPSVREIPEPEADRRPPTAINPVVRVGLEDTMLRVLDYILEAGGEVDDEPGKLLHRIADETGLDYYAVAPAVRRLEDVGFVQVERSVDPIPRQSNRVVRIAIV